MEILYIYIHVNIFFEVEGGVAAELFQLYFFRTNLIGHLLLSVINGYLKENLYPKSKQLFINYKKHMSACLVQITLSQSFSWGK